MKIVILAVTDARPGEYCIAGMTEDGQWVRPVPSNNQSRFWLPNQLMIANSEFIRAGDIINIEGEKPSSFQHPNHTEDYKVTGDIKWLKRLSNEELINFLKGKEENATAFINTVNANGRSLCLVKVKNIDSKVTQYEDNPRRPKIDLFSNEYNVTNPITKYHDYIVKDCKWSSLILNKPVIFHDYTEIYVAIGLATKWGMNGLEYPQIIGIHTDPFVEYPNSYPR